MAKDFKVPLKLTVDGENDFKKALKDCNSAMGLLTSESKKCSDEYAKNSDSLKALTKQQEVASSKVKVQQEKVELLRKALAEEVKARGEASDKAVKYAKDLNNAEGTLAKYKDEAKSTTEAVLTQNKAFQAAEKAAAGLAKGGLALLKGAGTAAVAAMGAMVSGAVALGKAVWDSADAAAEYGDAIDKSSQKMGVSAKEYQELAHVAELSGTSMDTLQKATVKLQQAGSDLDVSQALDQLYAIEDADERAAAAHKMLGDKIANELAPMLKQSSKEFKDAKKQAEDYGLVMSDAAVKASAAFSDTKTNLVDTVSMIKNNLASELLPGINEVMEGITGLFTGEEGVTQKIEDGINQLMDDLDSTIDKVSNILGKIVDAVMESAPTIIPSLVDGILSNLDKLIDCAFELIDALAEGLLTEKNIQLIMNSAVKLMMKLVDALLDNIDLIVDSAMTLVTSLCDALTDNRVLPKLATGALDVVKAIATALIDNAPELLDSALEMGAQLVQGLIDYDWKSLAKNIYNSIKDSIIGFFKGGSKSSNAGGLDYVPYDGYSAILHRGERVLTASEAQDKNRNSEDIEMLNRKLDFLMMNQKQADVNVNISGSAGAVIRALNVEIQRENRRKSAFA